MTQDKKMPVGKKITIILASVLIVLMSAVCLWYLMIYLFAPDKLQHFTFNTDFQTLADGSDTRPFMEIDYKSNKNGDGLEMLEIKYNSFRDETQTGFHTQGIQYVANSKNDKIEFGFFEDADKEKVRNYNTEQDRYFFPFFFREGWDAWGGYRITGNSSRYEFQDIGNNVFAGADTNLFDLNSMFLLEMGDDVYYMQMKGLESEKDENNLQYQTYESRHIVVTRLINWYAYYDIECLSKMIYEMLQPLQAGSYNYSILSFGNIFNYFDKTGEKLTTETVSDKVTRIFDSYYRVVIRKSEDGAKNAQEDSMFKIIHGESGFNLNPNRVNEGYYIGRSIINLSNNSFDRVNIVDNHVALKLKPEVKEYCAKYKDSIVLDVVIDIDTLKAKGYNFFAFANDSGLKDFEIYRIITRETINGEVVEQEVKI